MVGWRHRRRDAHDARSGGRRQRERGATLVEAAIVTPLFFLMIFGIVEFGSGYGDRLAVTNSVTAGARTASAAADDGFADYLILQEVAKNISASPTDAVNRVVIFEASGPDDSPSSTCTSGTSVDAPPATEGCNVYSPADFTKDSDRFGCDPNENLDRYWCPTDRATAQSPANGGPPDYVGVWMSFDHEFLTGLFGTTITITDQQVMRIEPRQL